MSKYQVWIINQEGNSAYLAKEYPYKIQAKIWCWLKGYVINMGKHGYSLDKKIKIQEVK